MAAKWIQGIHMQKGALTAKAKKAGKSIDEFCSGKVSGKTVRQCSLKKTLASFHK